MGFMWTVISKYGLVCSDKLAQDVGYTSKDKRVMLNKTSGARRAGMKL